MFPTKTDTKKRKVRKIFLSDNEKKIRLQIIKKLKQSKTRNLKSEKHLNIVGYFVSQSYITNVTQSKLACSKLLAYMNRWKIKYRSIKFSLRQKIIALAILKSLPRSYLFFANFFNVPTPTMLKRFIMQCKKPGVYGKTINGLRKNVSDTYFRHQRLCSVAFQEIELRNFEKKPTSYFVRAFMLEGLTTHYMRLIACKTHRNRDPKVLATELREVIKDVQDCGFNVKVTVCSPALINRKALKLLTTQKKNQSKEHLSFYVDNKEIIALYDPAYLMRGIRNQLLTKDILFSHDGVRKVASWVVINRFYYALKNIRKSQRGRDLLNDLTEDTALRLKVNRRNIESAVRIFSKAYGHWILQLSRQDEFLQFPADNEETGWFLNTMYALYETFNSHECNLKFFKFLPDNAIPVPGHLSMHQKIWIDALDMFKTMKFFPSELNKTRKLVVRNWIFTISGALHLMEKLLEHHKCLNIFLCNISLKSIDDVLFFHIKGHTYRESPPSKVIYRRF